MNKIALIRGAGMVIGYKELPIKTLNSSNFHALVVGGNACPQHSNTENEKFCSKRCDQLLALAEPPSHDDWTHKSDNLQFNFKWYGAPALIKRINNDYIKLIKNEIGQKEKVEGKASISLAKRLKFSQGDSPTSSRYSEVSVRYTKLNFEKDGSAFGEVKARIKIPEIAKIKNHAKGYSPKNTKIEGSYFIVGEEKKERIMVKLHSAILDGEEVKKSDQFEEFVNIEVPYKDFKQELNLIYRTVKLQGLSETYTKKESCLKVDAYFEEKD